MKFYKFEPQMGVEAYEFSETKEVGDSYEFTKLVLSYPADDFDDFMESDFMYFVTESLKCRLEEVYGDYFSFAPVECVETSSRKPFSRSVYRVMFDSAKENTPMYVAGSDKELYVSSSMLDILKEFDISSAFIDGKRIGM